MDQYVILRRDGWASADGLHHSAERSREVGENEMPDAVRWIPSYVLAEESGSLGTVCVYEAESPDALFRHAELAGLPCDEIRPIADTVIVRPDPATAGAR